MSKWYWLLVGAAVAIALAIVYASFEGSASERAGSDTLSWATTQGIGAGQVRRLHLPPSLARASSGGLDDVAHLRDGRYCILLVTSIGWKDNFEGRLICTGRLLPSEFVKPDDGRPSYVALAGYGVFEELYVRTDRSDRDFAAYFDLN